MSNLAVIASKLSLKFVDLLWVLSDAQVQSALLCVKSIKETIERSKQQSRNIADSQVNTKQVRRSFATELVVEWNGAPYSDSERMVIQTSRCLRYSCALGKTLCDNFLRLADSNEGEIYLK